MSRAALLAEALGIPAETVFPQSTPNVFAVGKDEPGVIYAQWYLVGSKEEALAHNLETGGIPTSNAELLAWRVR